MVNNAKDYKKYVSQPSFVSQKLFSKDLVAIHETKPVLTLDKPIYVGFCVLDLSKYWICVFHYNYIKTKLNNNNNNNVNLLFTDTGSIVYEI